MMSNQVMSVVIGYFEEQDSFCYKIEFIQDRGGKCRGKYIENKIYFISKFLFSVCQVGYFWNLHYYSYIQYN